MTLFRTSHYLVTLYFKNIAHVFKINYQFLLLLPLPKYKFIDRVMIMVFSFVFLKHFLESVII